MQENDLEITYVTELLKRMTMVHLMLGTPSKVKLATQYYSNFPFVQSMSIYKGNFVVLITHNINSLREFRMHSMHGWN